ncbi:unnamed protein product [Urochloa humidicola]
MDNATTSVSSSRNNEETGMQQIASDLQALKRLYGLLHKGSADENLDDTSKALMLKMLDDATQQALLKQAKMLSGSLMSPVLERKLSVRSDRRAPHDAEPHLSLRPPASPSLLAAGERPSRLNPQYSTVSSRAAGHVDGHRQVAEEPLLARLASYRSSRTTASALPPRHRSGGGEQRNSGLSLYRLPVAATSSRHGTVAGGSNRRADRRDMTRHGSSRGDRSSSLEGSSSSGRRSVPQEVSLGQARWRGSGMGRHVGAERSSSSTRRFGRLDSGLSLGMASRRGSERAGRGEASPEQSSSSNTVATIRSRIRTNQDNKERRLQRRGEEEEEEEESTPRRGSTGTSVSSSCRDDQSSPEASSRRSSVSRELSLGQARLHGRGATRHEGGGEGSCSTRRFGRSGSGLSLGLASRRGSERAGRGVASRERHSSSNTKASRTRPKPSQSIKERSLRRAEVERGESSRRRGRTDSSVSSGRRIRGRLPRRALKRIDSGSMYMSRSSSNSRGAAISCPSTSHMVSPEPSTSAASYSPPLVSRRGVEPPGSQRGIAAPPPVSWRGMAPPPPVSLRGVAPPPVYASRVTRSMRRRRRLEVLEKRVGRLRMLKSKIAMVFHHRHDHHHHFGRGGQEEEGPSSRAIPGEHHRGSPWGFLGEMFHRTERRGKEKTTSRMVVGAPPAKSRGGAGAGAGNIHALFDAVRRHLRSKRRAPATASVKMRRTANRSRALAKKMHWWQRLKQRRGRKEVAAGRPRRRLGFVKF